MQHEQLLQTTRAPAAGRRATEGLLLPPLMLLQQVPRVQNDHQQFKNLSSVRTYVPWYVE